MVDIKLLEDRFIKNENLEFNEYLDLMRYSLNKSIIDRVIRDKTFMKIMQFGNPDFMPTCNNIRCYDMSISDIYNFNNDKSYKMLSNDDFELLLILLGNNCIPLGIDKLSRDKQRKVDSVIGEYGFQKNIDLLTKYIKTRDISNFDDTMLEKIIKYGILKDADDPINKILLSSDEYKIYSMKYKYGYNKWYTKKINQISFKDLKFLTNREEKLVKKINFYLLNRKLGNNLEYKKKVYYFGNNIFRKIYPFTDSYSYTLNCILSSLCKEMVYSCEGNELGLLNFIDNLCDIEKNNYVSIDLDNKYDASGSYCAKLIDGERVIRVNPTESFGTFIHETTHLIDNYVRENDIEARNLFIKINKKMNEVDAESKTKLKLRQIIKTISNGIFNRIKSETEEDMLYKEFKKSTDYIPVNNGDYNDLRFKIRRKEIIGKDISNDTICEKCDNLIFNKIVYNKENVEFLFYQNFLDAYYGGEIADELCKEYDEVRKLYSAHVSSYFNESPNRKFKEMIANFAVLKLSSRGISYLNKIKDIIGEELYNMFQEYYERFIVSNRDKTQKHTK